MSTLMTDYTDHFDERDYIEFRTRVYLESQNVANNTSYIRIIVDLLCSNGLSNYGYSDASIVVKIAGVTKASVTGSGATFDFSSYTSKRMIDTYITISHDTDGTFSETIQTICDYNTYDYGSDSDTLVLTTIPRASEIGTISAFNVEDTFSVPITKYSASFTDTLVIKIGVTTIKTITGYTNGANINLTDDELLAAYAAITALSETFTFTTTTKSGSTTIGTDSATATGTVAGTAYIKVSGAWKRCVPYVKSSGVWKKAIMYSKVSGAWERGIA